MPNTYVRQNRERSAKLSPRGQNTAEVPVPHLLLSRLLWDYTLKTLYIWQCLKHKITLKNHEFVETLISDRNDRKFVFPCKKRLLLLYHSVRFYSLVSLISLFRTFFSLSMIRSLSVNENKKSPESVQFHSFTCQKIRFRKLRSSN